MGLGNGNGKSGDKGSNYNFEHRSLVLLGTISTFTSTGATEATLQSIEGIVSPFQRTPNLIRVTGPGNIASITYGFSVYNSGTINATVLGGVIKPGETFNFSPDGINNFYAAGSITYNATGSELVIIYNT